MASLPELSSLKPSVQAFLKGKTKKEVHQWDGKRDEQTIKTQHNFLLPNFLNMHCVYYGFLDTMMLNEIYVMGFIFSTDFNNMYLTIRCPLGIGWLELQDITLQPLPIPQNPLEVSHLQQDGVKESPIH